MEPITIEYQGWKLSKFEPDDEPRIHEYELAKRLEYPRDRNIRVPFERLRKAGKFKDSDVRQVLSARAGAVPRQDVEYWYNERAALLVIMESQTAKAMDVRVEVADVYLAVRRGLFVPAPVATPATVPETSSDRTLLTYPEVESLKSQIAAARLRSNKSGRDILKALRSRFGFKGYNIPYRYFNPILAALEGYGQETSAPRLPPKPSLLVDRKKSDLRPSAVRDAAQKHVGRTLRTVYEGATPSTPHPFEALFEFLGVPYSFAPIAVEKVVTVRQTPYLPKDQLQGFLEKLEERLDAVEKAGLLLSQQ